MAKLLLNTHVTVASYKFSTDEKVSDNETFWPLNQSRLIPPKPVSGFSQGPLAAKTSRLAARLARLVARLAGWLAQSLPFKFASC